MNKQILVAIIGFLGSLGAAFIANPGTVVDLYHAIATVPGLLICFGIGLIIWSIFWPLRIRGSTSRGRWLTVILAAMLFAGAAFPRFVASKQFIPVDGLDYKTDTSGDKMAEWLGEHGPEPKNVGASMEFGHTVHAWCRGPNVGTKFKYGYYSLTDPRWKEVIYNDGRYIPIGFTRDALGRMSFAFFRVER